MEYYEGTDRKNKAKFVKEELLSMKLIFLINVNFQMNLTLSLQTSGVNWQVKFQMVQQPSNPT